MSLKLKLTEDMKTAMKAGEKDRLGVIRLINAGIKQREVDARIEITDAVVLSVLEKMVKQRKDSITQYEAAAREDLAQPPAVRAEEVLVRDDDHGIVGALAAHVVVIRIDRTQELQLGAARFVVRHRWVIPRADRSAANALA